MAIARPDAGCFRKCRLLYFTLSRSEAKRVKEHLSRSATAVGLVLGIASARSLFEGGMSRGRLAVISSDPAPRRRESTADVVSVLAARNSGPRIAPFWRGSGSHVDHLMPPPFNAQHIVGGRAARLAGEPGSMRPTKYSGKEMRRLDGEIR